MFCLNHRSIKVTLFSEIHIKIISKISLTYHQIALLISFNPKVSTFILTLRHPEMQIPNALQVHNNHDAPDRR